MLDSLSVVLVKPKYSENIGAAARACVNMGCPHLVVVSPKEYDAERAAALATPKGVEVLNTMRMEDDLATALAGFTSVYGTTARTGGWRKNVSTPARLSEAMVEDMRAGSVAVVFGPEDRGLTNEEIEICGRLICIPTMTDASSLNLAQAVVVVLYECFKAASIKPFSPKGPPVERPANHYEQEVLFETLQDMLVTVDFLKDASADYWMLPVRRFLQRRTLKRNEFNLLMGVCKQIMWAVNSKERGE